MRKLGLSQPMNGSRRDAESLRSPAAGRAARPERIDWPVKKARAARNDARVRPAAGPVSTSAMEEGSSESAGGSEERSESDDSLEPEPEPEREATYTRGGKAALLPDYSYRYAGRSMAYRQEQLEISPAEAVKIAESVSAARRDLSGAPPFHSHSVESGGLDERLAALVAGGPRKIILDTDIGTDIDDVLALLMALHMPSSDVELLGITTNYHPTRLRQAVAKAVVSAAAAASSGAGTTATVAAAIAQGGGVPIIAGSSGLCGTHRRLFHHGNEGEGLGWSYAEKVAAWQPVEGQEAAEFLYQKCNEFPGEVTVVMTGSASHVSRCSQLPRYLRCVTHCGGFLAPALQWQPTWQSRLSCIALGATARPSRNALATSA